MISGFFTGAEISYVVANKIKIEIKARKKNLSAKNAKYFTENPQDFFSTVLIGTNVVNVAFASIEFEIASLRISKGFPKSFTISKNSFAKTFLMIQNQLFTFLKATQK
ncbi:MAG: DUF21 domain-containing protein [Bacteroidetes bacterium]|nr:DUF21 domain-containing protein [Bacteroidota bacterium]